MDRKFLFPILCLLLFIFNHHSVFGRPNSSLLYKKGATLAINGEIDKSIKVFKKVVAISPYYCLGHYGLGKAYLHKEGKISDAIKHLKKSIFLDKKFVKGYFYLGVAYYLNENYIQSIHAFKKTYDKDLTFIEALYNIGAVYDLIDKNLESRTYFNKYYREKYREDEDLLFE